MVDITVVAVDVGSLPRIGWWRNTSTGSTSWGRDLDGLAETVAADLNAGLGVALGFEAPLFIPRPFKAERLNRQRVGERGRPWSAGAGTAVLALGIQQSAYVLSAVARAADPPPRVTFNPVHLIRGEAELLIWEAFVSGSSKDRSAENPHVDDARRAVDEFRRRLDLGTVSTDIRDESVLNLAAASVLASGLSSDINLLLTPCIVVKPPDLGGPTVKPSIKA